MSTEAREPELSDRMEERPSLDVRKVREVDVRAIAIRFVAGALTSILAGLLTVGFGPHIGGIMLAFPAILAASLTLIAEEDDREEAREDARGAAAGGVALGVFAIVCAVLFGNVPGGVTLGLAGLAWLLCAVLLYVAFWWR